MKRLIRPGEPIVKRGKRLRLAGLIVGIAGIIGVTICGLFNGEGGPGWSGWWAILEVGITFVIPFLSGLLLSWKWPLTGSIILIFIGLFWLIMANVIVFSSHTSQAIVELLPTIFGGFAISLPQSITGILFLLSWKAERAVKSG
jgi:hypothetical protein